MTIDEAGSFLNQFLSHPFSLEGDEAEVLGFVVLTLIYGPDNLGNVAVLTEVLPDLVLAQPGVRQLPDINLPRLDIRFFNGYGLVLNIRIRNL